MTSNNVQEQAFYSDTGRGRGRSSSRGGQGGRFGNRNQQQQSENQFNNIGGRGQSRGRGSQRGRGGWQRNQQQTDSNNECYYCGKPGHMARSCYKKQNDIKSGKLQQGNYASSSKQAEDRSEQLFVMQHMLSSMTGDVSQPTDVWYVDSRASNHMTSHGEWF